MRLAAAIVIDPPTSAISPHTTRPSSSTTKVMPCHEARNGPSVALVTAPMPWLASSNEVASVNSGRTTAAMMSRVTTS